MKNRIISFFLAAVILVCMVPVFTGVETVKAAETAPIAIDSNTVWKYLDDNSDPAGADNALTGDARLTWTKADYDDSAWKSAKGPFGSNRGSTAVDTNYTANTLLAGNDGANNYMAYFFRTELYIEDADSVTNIAGSVSYDDSIVVYINGTPIARGGNTDYTYNLEYCGSGTSPIASTTFNITDNSILVDGTNIVAVELHQDRATSSDSWFNLPSITVTTNAPKYSNMSVNIGSNYSEMNFVWHVNLAEAGTLYIAKTADLVDGEMPEDALTFKSSKATKAKNGIDYYNKVTANGLLENTEYSYQIVTGDVKSDVYSFKTGAPTGAFSFIFAGDPQVGQTSVEVDRPLWENSLAKIEDSVIFDDISFMMVSGDHVNSAGTEAHYDAYLDHEYLYNLPTVDVIGNHDSFNNAWKDKNSIFFEHFTLPNESSKCGCVVSDAGGNSWLVYNNVLFINLNSNHSGGSHVGEYKAFMESAIAANPEVSWKVVMFHHSVFSVGYHSADDPIVNLRNAIVPVIEELDIDVVLMGHDHVYCRTYMMDGLNPMRDASIYDNPYYTSITDPEGILYVTANSASGSKYYDVLNTVAPYAAVQNQEKVPNISKIYVSDTQFAITTYRLTDMSIVDTFAINRSADVIDSEVVNVKVLISLIGEVTVDSIPRIEAARKAYEALADEQKELVTNYDVLLAAESVDFDVINVETLIAGIGKLTPDSSEKVEAARAAYEALTDEQQTLVKNYSVLVDAETALANALDNTVIVTSGYDSAIGVAYPEKDTYLHYSGRDYNTDGLIYSDDSGKFTKGTAYTISFKARTLPYHEAGAGMEGKPAIIRVLSPNWATEFFEKITLTSEWTAYTTTTTAFYGSLYFLGSGAAYGYAPFDIKDLTITLEGSDENLAENVIGLKTGSAGWFTTDSGGSYRNQDIKFISNDKGYLIVPKSVNKNATAFTFNSNETLAAGKYEIKGDFKLVEIDFGKYVGVVAELTEDGNIANITLNGNDAVTVNCENWTTATFTVDSVEAFAKNSLVFTLDQAIDLGVKNLEITLIESYESEVPEPERIDFAGTTMTLGSSLSLDFAIDITKVSGEGNYAVLTIEYADGRPSMTITVPQDKWVQYRGNIYTAKFVGMAAKEMNDVVTAILYNAEGQPISNPKSDSIVTYSMRAIPSYEGKEDAESVKYRSMYVDMINYGAAAQEEFKYDVENPANKVLSETHKAWASELPEITDSSVKGIGCAGSTLGLEGEIQLNFVFDNSAVGEDYSKLYAIATYTDHYGKEKELRIEGADFNEYGDTMCRITVVGMAVADYESLVTCEVYNSNGVKLSYAIDSVESYASRALGSGKEGPTIDKIVKFASSAYDYFHYKDNK